MPGIPALKTQTNFEAGGLFVKEDTLFSATTPKDFQVPEFINNMGWVCPTDNQGDRPRCAAYAWTGHKEVLNWQETGFRKQIDPNPIYAEAKRLDGNNDPGTYLESVARAGINLGHMSEDTKIHHISRIEDVCHALHKSMTVIAGFSATRGWNSLRKGYWIDEEDNRALGGHAVLITNYDLRSSENRPAYVGIHNSWGDGWGWHGNARMGTAYFKENLIDAIYLEH